uniref:Uncharacterized protein n=1 Tax=Arion vulgaris TaxID=1028688 RepID=A0A0B7BI74_9EUPU
MRILRIFCLEKITNDELEKKTNCIILANHDQRKKVGMTFICAKNVTRHIGKESSSMDSRGKEKTGQT